MTGYENSPDYGGGPNRWWWIPIVVFVLALAGVILWGVIGRPAA